MLWTSRSAYNFWNMVLRHLCSVSTALAFEHTDAPQFFFVLQGESHGTQLEQWRARLEYYVYKMLGELRIAEMFDIVVDYPESLPAV